MTAEVTLTPLNNNTPADADDVMGNFNALKNEIESLPTPPSTCETNQIIKWNGTAWACAADPLANLSCSAGDTLTYNGSAFTCSCVRPAGPLPIVTLTRRLLIGLLVVTPVNTAISPSGVLGL